MATTAPVPSASASNGDLPLGFEDDDRVYFYKETGTWRYEADDGAEMEYDAAKGVWLPVVSNCTYGPEGRTRYAR